MLDPDEVAGLEVLDDQFFAAIARAGVRADQSGWAVFGLLAALGGVLVGGVVGVVVPGGLAFAFVGAAA